jgi:uncharacterized membrane protein
MGYSALAILNHQTRLLRGLTLGAAGLLVVSTERAHAAFTICNQMLDIANIAIGEAEGTGIETRGWWVVAPNRCADVIPADLKSRYVYVYAVDARGRDLLDGTTRFCTAPQKFRITGTTDCWERGFTTGLFEQIDTRDASGWTLFLKEEARP